MCIYEKNLRPNIFMNIVRVVVPAQFTNMHIVLYKVQIKGHDRIAVDKMCTTISFTPTILHNLSPAKACV